MTETEFYNRFKSVDLSYEVNYKRLPVSICNVNDIGMDGFNDMLDFIYDNDFFSKIVRTSSGGISTNRYSFLPPMYDVRTLNSCVELTVIGKKMFRLQFRSDAELKKGTGISGAKAFNAFRAVCEKYNINLESYMITNGKEVKETIPAPWITFDNRFSNMRLTNAHHLDIHSAYMANIALAFKDLRKPIEEIFEERKNPKNNLLYKAILTHSFGFFQSRMLGYSLAHLSKAAIEGTISQLKDLTKKLQEAGNVIVAYNTDGIWYIGNVYHGDGEGKCLGQWENDHHPDELIFKGIGTYGYTENGKFTPVVRGLRNLDKIKPRSEWQLSDLDNLGAPLKYGWDGGYIVKL